MESALIEAAKQVPALLIFAFVINRIITLFLDYLKEQRQLDRDQSKETITKLTEEIRLIRQDDAVNKAEILKEAAAYIQKVDDGIRDVRDLVDNSLKAVRELFESIEKQWKD